MTSLNDPIWQQLTGGYKHLYDASVILKRLASTNHQSEESVIWEEIWNELHHQGDLGTASYLAIPQIVAIAKSKGIIDSNTFSFIAVVEIERHRETNPDIPPEYTKEYHDALNELPDLVKLIQGESWDGNLASNVLRALAAANSQIKMAEIIGYLGDSDYLTSCKEFLENY